jgi:hypothetical protein
MRLFAVFSLVAWALLAGCYGTASPNAVPAATIRNAGFNGIQLRKRDDAGLIFSVSASNNGVDYYVKGTGPNNPVLIVRLVTRRSRRKIREIIQNAERESR